MKKPKDATLYEDDYDLQSLSHHHLHNRKNHLKRNDRKVALLSLSLCFGLSFGFMSCSVSNVDYSKYTFSELDDDYEALYLEYLNNPNPLDYEPYQLANIAFYQYEQEENHYSEVHGEVDAAGTEQSTRAFYLKEGNEYFWEMISTTSSSLLSSVNNALRIYQHQEKEQCDFYYGKPLKKSKAGEHYGVVADFSEDDYSLYTLEELREYIGRDLTRSSNHIISSKTVIDQSQTTTNNGYSLTLHLDPVKGVVRYVNQMRVCGNLNNDPVFSSVYIDLELDNDLNLISASYHEEYQVKIVGINFNSKGVTTERFFHHVKYEEGIPALETSINYTDWEVY